MKKLCMNRNASLGLAMLVGLLGEACSDNGGNKQPGDGGAADGLRDSAPDTRVADVLLADAPLPDLAASEVVRTEVAVVDAPVVDAASLDAGPVDVSIMDAADAPAGDGGNIDGGAAALVARGKYLVDHVIACSDCHTPKLASGAPDITMYLAGNAKFVQLPTGDVLPSRNLTPDEATGLGSYTADQIKHMFMDGLVPNPDGGSKPLNPVMPYYVFHNLAADDADAIVAYLQSIPAVNNPLPDRSASFEVPAPAAYLDPTAIPLPANSYPQKASALRGRYLASESGLCIECHTEHLPPGGAQVLDTSKLFAGGEDFSAFFAGTLNIHPVSANLTSDPDTGLGGWTTEQIVTVLLQGKDDQGTGICPPMPAGPNGAYGGLSAGDALDIANYIKSLPPVVNDVPDMCSWPPAPPPVDGGGVDGAGLDGGGG